MYSKAFKLCLAVCSAALVDKPSPGQDTGSTYCPCRYLQLVIQTDRWLSVFQLCSQNKVNSHFEFHMPRRLVCVCVWGGGGEGGGGGRGAQCLATFLGILCYVSIEALMGSLLSPLFLLNVCIAAPVLITKSPNENTRSCTEVT